MHIGWFGEASFGLKGQEAGKLFVGVRYATEQSSSLGKLSIYRIYFW